MKFRTSLSGALALLPLVAIACSSSKGSGGAPPTDSGVSDSPPPSEASVADAGDAGDSSTSADAADAATVVEPTYDAEVQPGCEVNGCIRSLTQISADTYTQTQLEVFAASNFAVQNGVNAWEMEYWSNDRQITGALFVPDSTPPDGGFGVVIMNQPTSGIGAPCSPTSGLLGLGFASSTALNGIVTFVPDGTTYGAPPYGAYMVADIAGRAALDAVRAVLHTTIVPIAQRAIIAGLSQGAFSTMGAARELLTYAPNLPVRGFVAAEPPAFLETSFQRSAQLDDVSVTFDLMRLYSWQGLYNLSGGELFQGNPDAAVNDDAGYYVPDSGPVDYAVQAPYWFATECVYNSDGTDGTIFSYFPDNSSTVLTPTFLAYAQNASWPADWAKVYADSVSIPTGVKLPFLLTEGTLDTTVLPADAERYAATLQDAGLDVTFMLVDGGTHGTTALGSFTTVMAGDAPVVTWIQTRLAQ